MSKFLYYSDYKRFIVELEECREFTVIASLMSDFVKFYYEDNPSMFHIFLDALWNVYPDYDMECEVDAVLNYDEDFFNEYESPKFEFVGQYLYYLSDEYFEAKLSSNMIPYDFSEEEKYIKKEGEETTKIIEPTKPTIKPTRKVSFGIKDKYEDNITKIAEYANDEAPLYEQEDFPEKFAKFLTARDISTCNKKDPIFHLGGKTNLFVAFIDEIQKVFNGKFHDVFFENYCSIFTKKNLRLGVRNIQTVRNRNLECPPLKWNKVLDVIKQHAPSITT